MAAEPDIWHCDHDKTRLVNRVISNGVRTTVHQCQCCGRQTRAVKRDASEVAVWQAQHGPLDEWNDAIGINWDASRKRLWRANRAETEAAKEQQNADWWSRYHAHLASPKWADLRKLTLKRANYRCEGCGIGIASEAHHTTYEHMGDEFLFELLALCPGCHERLHGKSA
jgi:hypothetical protein